MVVLAISFGLCFGLGSLYLVLLWCFVLVMVFVVVVWGFVVFDELVLCLVVCLGLFGVAAWCS